MQSRWMLPALLASLALGAFAFLPSSGCGPSVPASPAYDVDVLPIFAAHCNRCHGNGPDGGMLNNARQPVPDGGPLKSDPLPLTLYHAFLTQYADSGDCTPVDGGLVPDSCHFGALTAAKQFSLSEKVHGTIQPRMPPVPAAMLDDYELKVIDAWVKNPICSNAKNPDPNVCPPGVGP